SCQNLPNLPTLDVFLSWLLDVTSNEIENIANSFDFHEVSPKDIKFILHTPTPNKTALKITHENMHMINATKPTKLVIHGWQATGTDDVNSDLAETYRKKGDYNVIAVDWSEHSKKIYMHASSSTKTIGSVIGDFILDLIKQETALLDNIHLIGHSLGGHIAGFAGKRVLAKTGKKVGRITGLDVAAPMFEVPKKRDANSRLNKNDAEFVDIIHTNAGFLGVSDPIGTVDFYVENGGPLQPGCFDILNIFESFACSHYKAFEYYHDSITDKKFEALACPNSIDYHILMCINNKRIMMGEDTPRNATGTFYLETDSPLPYSKLFENQLRIKINRPPLPYAKFFENIRRPK
ncbi:phospholipase A1, partial [Asbolus verrucosus]